MSQFYQARRGAIAAAGVAAISAFVMSAASADAQYYRRGRGYYAPGAAIGLGVAGGLLAGAAIAGAARPAPVIVEEPIERECWYERRRVWDGYGYIRQRVRVCD